MRHSLIVKCYLCGLDADPSLCSGVFGLGPAKYVCRACQQGMLVSVVMAKHDEKNAANRRYLAKRARASGIEQ